MTTTVFNKCNCLNFKNKNLNDLNGYKQKVIIGSFLPLCDDCLRKDSIKIKYRLTIDKHDVSSTDIPELISMIKFLIKEKQTNIMVQNHLMNDMLLKWIQSISGRESTNELLRSIAIKIDNGLKNIWDLAHKKEQLPCNINIIIVNVNTKEELYNTYWSYQYCEFYFQ